MTLFTEKKAGSYTIVIGCGRLGAYLANELSNKEENVLIMDKTKDSFRRLSSGFGGLSVVGNGTDLDKLREAQIERASAVIAVTNDDNTNIMAAQIARELFHVNLVIARLYDPERETVYRELGIDTICSTLLSGKVIDRLLDGSPAKEAFS